MGTGAKAKELRERIKDLESRLEQAEEVLSAIRNGEVDALVVSGAQGEQVFTLQTADRPYRQLIEAMNEGAVTLNSDGVILYCNQCFATMLDLPLEQALGAAFPNFIAENDLPLFDALLQMGQRGDSKGEVALKQSGGRYIPALLSLSAMPLDEMLGVSVVVTDLTESKRQAETMASASLARSILEHAAEAMVVCDEAGRIILANRRAHQLRGGNPMLRLFDETFPLLPAGDEGFSSLHAEGSGSQAKLTFAAIRRGPRVQGVEALYAGPAGEPFHLLLSAGAVVDDNGASLGWVINLTNITGLKQAERERELLLSRERAARREAEQSSRLKDEFLANVSHELRTPLNAMLGWARLLRLGNLDGEGTERAVQIIERSARAQSQLIDDLLDVSRIITGNLRLDTRSVNPAEFIDAALEAVRPAADAKEIRIEQVWASGAGSVQGDSTRLQQVVWNLVSNAIKFTPRQGRVVVKIKRSELNLEISVSDSGNGISPEFLPFVFDRFRQADGTSTRRHGGLGLGLAIVRQLVELHGGTVQVESPGELGGATFNVQLPCTPVFSVTHEVRAYQQSREGVAEAFPAGDLAGLNILVIDDELVTLELIKLSLGQYGAVVHTAGSAAEALALLDTIRPTVIVGDIGMPDEDGYEFIRRLRALPKERGGAIPAVALTAYARPEDRLRVLQAGYQTHLAKPVEISELVATVSEIASNGRHVSANGER